MVLEPLTVPHSPPLGMQARRGRLALGEDALGRSAAAPQAWGPLGLGTPGLGDPGEHLGSWRPTGRGGIRGFWARGRCHACGRWRVLRGASSPFVWRRGGWLEPTVPPPSPHSVIKVVCAGFDSGIPSTGLRRGSPLTPRTQVGSVPPGGSAPEARGFCPPRVLRTRPRCSGALPWRRVGADCAASKLKGSL